MGPRLAGTFSPDWRFIMDNINEIDDLSELDALCF
jgi:hypothetical protein